MTLEQQLKHYITNLFKLPKDEKWECESIEEIADHILPDQYVRLGPLSNKILQTYTYYSDTLQESNIYPFILYYQKQLIAIGYIDETNDMDFLYLHNTVMPLLDQRHLLEKENHNNE
ncbi:SAUGI family uracil-DNA glycosylase inhibitor [Mammaliicoccus sciuri]|uniref:SAUGI family uracil-DNA glycosylase inhibitor n=1 Tax=Mammaliicoccus sciuri TaxID=1296 RepID=UPI00047356F8|nr:SAUGI family uracil-DNA glycosylase inhibitor [Mammaliicoccus sciuri]